jgi:hypothetical protein
LTADSASEFPSLVLVGLLQEAPLARVVVDAARQGGLEAGEVRAAFVRVDVVDEGEDRLVVAVVVLDGELDPDIVAFGVDIQDLGVQRLLVLIEVLHHLPEPALGVEGLDLGRIVTLVGQRNRDALVQKREFAQAAGEGGVVVVQVGEDLRIGFEVDLRPAVTRPHLPGHLEPRRGGSAYEVHVVLFSVALHPHLQLLGERIHHRHADPVESAGHLVTVLVELAAGVQHGHRHFQAGDVLGGMDVHRDSTSVIRHGDGIVRVNDHGHRIAVTGQRFVNRVVDDLVDQVMQTARRR